MAAVITAVSAGHSLLAAVERAVYGRRLARTEVREPPIFIIGHWRTGTTWLHELLALDERFTYPSTYECLEPNHFLLTEGFFRRWFGFLMPDHRPMDNMAAGWDRPQEDEFALCMMGQPSPYLKIAFPNHPAPFPEYLDLEGLSPRALASWQRAYGDFLRRVTFRRPKRLILKSPTHSCRIPTLLKLFPDARFVHIVRDPRVVFPSTVHLWKSLYRAHGLQNPRFEGLEEYVFENFLRLYDRLEAGRRQVDPARFFDLKYEDLVRDPIGQMAALYDHLGLGGFDLVRPRLERSLAENARYETNRYDLDPDRLREIERRWDAVIRRYGYDAG
jgi:LPS sulfotransferase NodH